MRDFEEYSSAGLPAGDAPSFPAQEELERAKKLISEREFGRVAEDMSPFSKQFKSEVADRFPIDGDVHDKAEQERDAFTRHHIELLWDSAKFVGGLVALAAVSPRVMGAGMLDSALPKFLLEHPVVFVALVLVASFVGLNIRKSIRRKFAFHELHDVARNIAALFTNRCDAIDKQMMDAGRNAQNRSSSENWTDSAGKWMMVLLWLAARWEDLDRFCTAHLWKMRHSIALYERTFQGVRLVIAAAGLLFLAVFWLGEENAVRTSLSASYLLSAIWILAALFLSKGQIVDREICDRELEKELASENGYTSTHYFDLSSQLVANLVESICVNDRQKGGGRNAA